MPAAVAHGAVRAVAADHVSGAAPVPRVPSRGAACAVTVSVPRLQRRSSSTPRSTVMPAAARCSAEDAFGFGLGQEQQVRVRGVGQAEVEQRHRQYSGRAHACAAARSGCRARPAASVTPRPARTSRVRGWMASARDSWARSRRAVDQARADAVCGQRSGEAQAGGSGADDEHVDRVAGHDLTVGLRRRRRAVFMWSVVRR